MSRQTGGMNDRIGIELGKRLRELRSLRGLTQAQFANLARKSVETISNFERGQTLPSLRTLADLSRVLGVGMAELFELPKGRAADNQALNLAIDRLAQEDRELLLDFAELLRVRKASRKKRKSS